MELKDWCKYLPYEVMVQGKGYGDSLTTKTLKEYPSSYGTAWVSLEFAMSHKLKPILRPLSQLTEEIKVNGERFVAIDYLWVNVIGTDSDNFDKEDFYEMISLGMVELLPYKVVEKLHEWHFDTGKYFEKGEAVEKINN